MREGGRAQEGGREGGMKEEREREEGRERERVTGGNLKYDSCQLLIHNKQNTMHSSAIQQCTQDKKHIQRYNWRHARPGLSHDCHMVTVDRPASACRAKQEPEGHFDHILCNVLLVAHVALTTSLWKEPPALGREGNNVVCSQQCKVN